jgi:DNA-binding GntR family transcriptional regulator
VSAEETLSKPYRTIQEYVLGTLRAEILKGVYPPNSRLRQEEVAKRLDVSTTPVREAFRDLRAEGLVSIDPNRGVVIRGLTADDVIEIYELRMVLEPMLTERASRQLAPADLAAAAACHDTMCATTSSEKWALLNVEFHRHLMASQAKTRLFEIVEGLSGVARPYVSLSMHLKQDLMESNNREHGELLDAFRAGDAEAVRELSRIHLENTRNAIVACVAQWASTDAVSD